MSEIFKSRKVKASRVPQIEAIAYVLGYPLEVRKVEVGATKSCRNKTIKGAGNGFVYILANAAFPGLYKIGMTNRTVIERAAELTASTSSPHPFFVVYQVATEDALGAEQAIHKELALQRTSTNREFFSGELKYFIEVVDRVAKLYGASSTSVDDREWGLFIAANGDNYEHIVTTDEASKLLG